MDSSLYWQKHLHKQTKQRLPDESKLLNAAIGSDVMGTHEETAPSQIRFKQILLMLGRSPQLCVPQHIVL